MLPPGSTIGILGGGQLGRMTAMAAACLGYRAHIFATEHDSPAAQVSAAATVAPFGVATTEFREIADLDALTTAIGELVAPAVLKTVRMGYDGKGQVLVAPDSEPQEAWRRMGGSLGILEGFVDFRCEISVVLARAAD